MHFGEMARNLPKPNTNFKNPVLIPESLVCHRPLGQFAFRHAVTSIDSTLDKLIQIYIQKINIQKIHLFKTIIGVYKCILI